MATLGPGELLSLGRILIPLIWDKRPSTNQVHFPLTFHFTIEPIVFSADHLVALIVAPLALLGVAMMLRFTSIGIAIRASAEGADRASLLGVPVKRLQTVVWSVAALLSFVGVFLQAGIQGLPILTGLDLTVLLASLAALMLGNLVDLPAVAVSAVALGLLQQGITWNNPPNPELVEPIFAVVIIVCLLVRKVGATRADQDTSSSWQVSDEVRPVPRELKSLPEVRAVRWGGGPLACGVALWLPLWFGVGDQLKASAAVIFVIIVLSVVVLTGWAGQVSLGQMSFAAFGAAVGAYATINWHLDLGLSLLLAGFGAVVALIVGLPALRLRGFFLAVTTLAFAMATSAYSSTSSTSPGCPTPTPPSTGPVCSASSTSTRSAPTTRVPGCAGARAGGPWHPPQSHRTGAAGPARERTRRPGLRRQRAPGQVDRLRPLGIPRRGGRLPAGASARRVQSDHLRARPELHRVHRRGGGWPRVAAGGRLGSLYLKGAQWWLPGASGNGWPRPSACSWCS